MFTAVFTLFGLWPLLEGGAPRWWMLGSGAALLVTALARPALFRFANRGWTRLGLLLHSITSPILVGLVFYLVVTPTGLILRMLGKDLLRLRFDPGAETYWIRRDPPGPSRESMVNQF